MTDSAHTLVIPSNVEAEQAVLGALLIDPDAIIAIAPIVRADDFYLEKHGWVYQAVIALNRRHEPIDFLTVVTELERRGKLNDVGGAAYITALINAVPTAVHAEHYAQIIRQSSLQRRLIAAAGDIAGFAYDPRGLTSEQMIAQASQSITEVSQSFITDNGRTLAEVMNAAWDRIEQYVQNPREVWGIPTGFDLDRVTGGLHKKELFVLSGDPGVGKTSWLLDATVNAALLGKSHAVIFSLEMSAEELALRMISSRTGINTHLIKRGRLDDAHLAQIVRTTGELSELPIRIFDLPTDSTTLTAKVARLAQRGEADLVIADYSKLFLDQHRDEPIRLGLIAQAMKNLAKVYDVASVLVHPVTRGPAAQNRKPDQSDLGWSWDVVYHADTVVFAWKDKSLPKDDLTAELVIAKNRNGATISVPHMFDPTLTRWGNAARDGEK